MKRLCIYATYDLENNVDDYIAYMLQEVRKVVDSLVVICNYAYIDKGIANVQPYADKIFYRANKGFDAGAYKDVLCQYLGWDEIDRYDELLLSNDSFYGPIYPMKDLFDRMDQTDVDYWGMIRCPAGRFDDNYNYDSHIQSYFLVFKKTVLRSMDFKIFWENLVYPENLSEAVLTFELGYNRYFMELGYKGAAFTDFYPEQFMPNENEIPYLLYSLELVRDMKFPFIKRKCFELGNKGFFNAVKVLKYIENKGIYDINLVKKHLLRRSCQGKGMINVIELEKFYQEHSKIYFYGAGTYGRNLAIWFRLKGWQFGGFLVTDEKEQPCDCMAFDKVEIGEQDGIIITVMNAEMYLEILNIVEKRCNKSQIFKREF